MHRARLKGSRQEVAVKIQYPNIARTIRTDMANFKAIIAPMRLSGDWDNLMAQFEDVRRMLDLEVDYEQEARNALRFQDRSRLEDRVWRSYGMLRSARIISTNEAMSLLSAIRMGICLDMIKDIKLGALNEIIVNIQRAHLQKRQGRELPPEERDVIRANYIRKKLVT